MTLKDLIFENDKNDSSQTNDIDSYINDIVKSKNLEKFVKDIQRPKYSGKKPTGFFINNIFVQMIGDNGKPTKIFANISQKLRNTFGNNLKDQLQKLAPKNERARDFIVSLASMIANPDNTLSKGRNNDTNQVVSPQHYADIGESLVYRSSEFVSKLADSKTKVDKNVFNQLMIDAFNSTSDSGENENFLMQFTDIDQKMRLDAAKKTVEQVETNGTQESDAEQQIGENPNKEENYYINLQNSLHTSLLLEDDVKVPRSVSEFSQNAKEAAKQVDAVEKAWPRQFKHWYDQYQAKFEEGVKKGQDAMRASKDGTAEKEVVDPLTNKKLKGRKAWGTGGPNAFIRDHEYLNKLCTDIKNDKPVTIFNLGPQMILGIFDMIEHGGKILQGIKDDFGEAFKDIKKLLKSGSSKDFDDQIDKLIEEEQYGAAEATAQSSAVVQFSQLLYLLQNGPIGTVDLSNKTFSTAMNNSQTSIEIAMQNLLAAMDKYSDTEKRFEENKDVKINDSQTDSQIGGKSEEKPTEKDQSSEQDDDEEMDDSYKPMLKNFILTEEDNSDSDESQGDAVKKDDEDESATGITHEDQADQTLNDMALIKQNFDDVVDKNRLKEVKEALEKFKGEEGDVIRDKDGNASDFTNLDKIIDLYRLLIEDDLKFNLDSASLKDFLDGLKKYLDDFKEIPAIENLAVKIADTDTKWPAMNTTGKLEKKTSGGTRAAELSKKIKEHQDSLVKSKIATLNSYAKDCKDDSWLNGYEKTTASLDDAVTTLRKELETVYKTLPNWFDKYFNEFKTKNYLTKLYMLMACMTGFRQQLDKMKNDEDSESNQPDSEDDSQEPDSDGKIAPPSKPESVIPKTLLRSLYIAENDQQQDGQVQAGNNDPTQEKHNQEKFREGGKQEPVKHNITELFNRLEKIDLNSAVLSTDPNADMYVKNDPKNFTDLQRKFALGNTGLSIAAPGKGNGIAAIIRHILEEQKNQGKKNIEILKKNNCTKLAAFFSGEGASQHTDRKDQDLFVLLAAAWGCAYCLKKNLSNAEQNLDTKREDSPDNQSGQNGENQDSQNQSSGDQGAKNTGNQQNNSNNQGSQENASVKYPDVSPDSFLNEIYKYIRG